MKHGTAIAIPHVTEAPELDPRDRRDAKKLELVDAILAIPEDLPAPPPVAPPPPERIYDQVGAAFAAARADFLRAIHEHDYLLPQERPPADTRGKFHRACLHHVELIKDDLKRKRALEDFRAERDRSKRFGPLAAARAFAKLIGNWQP